MPPTLCARPKAGRTMVCALRFGAQWFAHSALAQKGSGPTGAGPFSNVASREVFFPPYTPPGKMISFLSAASAGNQEGAPAPSWNFPRTEDEGRKPPFRCLLLPVAPTIRLAAKRLRRRTPSPRRAITTQSRRQNYQAFPTLVPHKAKTPESPQSPRPHPPSQRPSYRNPPYSSGWFPKEGPQPFLWS